MILEMCLAIDLTLDQSFPVIVLTIAFCVCGAIAVFTTSLWAKIGLGMLGSFYCLVVLFILWSVALSNTTRLSRCGTVNIVFASLIWPIFILTWGLGPDVYGVMDFRTEFWWESSLSLVLKTVAMIYVVNEHTDRFNGAVDMCFRLAKIIKGHP